MTKGRVSRNEDGVALKDIVEGSDLPRIVVEDDKIIVEDGDWVERSEGAEEESVGELGEDFKKEERSGSLEEVAVGGVFSNGNEGEEGYVVSEISAISNFGDFYNSKDADKYSSVAGEYEKPVLDDVELADRVGSDLGPSGVLDDFVLKDRTVLEIIGFRDEEAEKKREKSKRFPFA